MNQKKKYLYNTKSFLISFLVIIFVSIFFGSFYVYKNKFWRNELYQNFKQSEHKQATIVAPVINIITPATGKIGEEIMLKGEGFDGENIVYFKSSVSSSSYGEASWKTVSENGSILKFLIPQELFTNLSGDKINVSAGTYNVQVYNYASDAKSNVVMFIVMK